MLLAITICMDKHWLIRLYIAMQVESKWVLNEYIAVCLESSTESKHCTHLLL